MADINKESLEHLAELARLELDSETEGKMIADLTNILNHFKELESLDTKDVRPMTGGTSLKNIFREDGAGDHSAGEKDSVRGAFPESDKRFLRVPPVFSAEGGSAKGGE